MVSKRKEVSPERILNKEEKIVEDVIVPDTSVIIEGILSEKIRKGELVVKKIIIHEAVLAELEAQANKRRDTGYIGLEEIKILRQLSKEFNFTIEYSGYRPTEFEIKFAKTGEIDNLIRELAMKENATLVTADKVQSLVAESKGIKVIYYEFEEVEEEGSVLDKYFIYDDLMSVHLKEGCKPFGKKGSPGHWHFVELSDEPLSSEEMESLLKEVIEEAERKKESYIESERKGSYVLQLGHYRVVITKPPLSDAIEFTIVKPIAYLTLDDYKLDEKLLKRLEEKAEGILISGAPGQGKSTFAQALAAFYASQGKIVKTVEAPRDLTVPNNVTQYGLNHASFSEIRDILLLSRPDYTFYDEMRNPQDFALYSDLRLAGVGMVGIVHATKPIDAIQRFIGKIELGMIPQVVDTVIYIEEGRPKKVYKLDLEVKVPFGMQDADLARPVVVVRDFFSDKEEYEIYTYGEETVVVPVTPQVMNKGALKLAERFLEQELSKYSKRIKVRFLSVDKCIVYAPEKVIGNIIGKKGEEISKIEKKYGVKIDVRDLSELSEENETGIKIFDKIDVVKSKNNLILVFPKQYANSDADLFVGEDKIYFATIKVGKNAEAKLKATSKLGKKLQEIVKKGKEIYASFEE